MTALSKDAILESLRAVIDEQQGGDIVSLEMVRGLQVSQQGEVVFLIEVDPQRGGELEPLRQRAENVVRALKNVRKVTAVLTAEAKHSPANVQGRTSSPSGAGSGARTSAKSPQYPDPHGMNKVPPLSLPARNIIAVASGKGGVGKSTLATNIAVMLAKNGQKTALLDADIYGPSQPRLLGLEGRKPDSNEAGKIIPLEAYGIKVMSIGFMVEASKALIWRGPMVQSALVQLMRDVAWAPADDPLDYLIIDMPPGTGDAQLTMAQKVSLTGAIIVSTPQDIALLDARKGIEMFRKTDVPVLGLIENMSTYICPECGHEDHIFGHGGARDEAQKLGVPFLGEVPLSRDIRLNSDEGTPIAIAAPNSKAAQSYAAIVKNLMEN